MLLVTHAGLVFLFCFVCIWFVLFLHWLWRFSPRLNPKKKMNDNNKKIYKRHTQDMKSDFFFIFIFIFFCHWNLSQMCLYEAERMSEDPMITDSYAECVCRVSVRVCLSIVHTFLGTEVLLGTCWMDFFFFIIIIFWNSRPDRRKDRRTRSSLFPKRGQNKKKAST